MWQCPQKCCPWTFPVFPSCYILYTVCVNIKGWGMAAYLYMYSQTRFLIHFYFCPTELREKYHSISVWPVQLLQVGNEWVCLFSFWIKKLNLALTVKFSSTSQLHPWSVRGNLGPGVSSGHQPTRQRKVRDWIRNLTFPVKSLVIYYTVYKSLIFCHLTIHPILISYITTGMLRS